MAAFQDLPNELIYEIWLYLSSPRDIASFSLVSRNAHNVGWPFIKKHYQLRSKYKAISNKSSGKSVLARLLKDTLTRPIITEYVEKLSISEPKIAWDYDPDVETIPSNAQSLRDLHLPYPKADMKLFIRQFRECIPHGMFDHEVWTDEMRAGDENPIIILVLQRLKHLTTLVIEDVSNFEYIYSCIGRAWSFVRSDWLPNLTKVEIGRLDPGEHETWTVSLIHPFISLPSLREMRCYNLDGSGSSLHRLTRSLPHKKTHTLTHLVLKECTMSTENMVDILDTARSLTHFELSSTTNIADPFHIRGALLTHTRRSLESLVLNCPYTWKYIGSLHRFRCLRYLEIEFQMLISPYSKYHPMSINLHVYPPSLEELVLRGDRVITAGYVKPVAKILLGAKDKGYLEALKLVKWVLYNGKVEVEEQWTRDRLEELNGVRDIFGVEVSNERMWYVP